MIIIILGIAGLVLLFVMLTDGRYFGKVLVWWVYDRLGPALFGAQSETKQWRELIGKLGLQGDERVLDVGTAVGNLLLNIASMPGFCGQSVGLDWSQRMILAATKEAKRRGLEGQIKFEVADIRAGLPFGDGEFDIVFCLGVLEALPQPELVLKELQRVLAPQGVLVLSLYRPGWFSRYVVLSLKWYKRHLPELGLTEVKVISCQYGKDVVRAHSHILS